jgi:plastocyanin domain-containing protein
MWLINIAGLLLIFAIVWWFWLYEAKTAASLKSDTRIIVENGTYQPARIQLPANQAVKLQFLRQDASPCAESVLFPDLEISEQLPLGQVKTVNLPPLEAGRYRFECQMQMYHGELEVK